MDPNDLPLIPMDRIHHYADDVVVEGPHHPSSSLPTLIKVPINPPWLENVDPISVPAPRVCGQHTIQSKGHPNSHYCSPSYHPLKLLSYHPYATPISVDKELVNHLQGTCECLSYCYAESTASSLGSESLTGL